VGVLADVFVGTERSGAGSAVFGGFCGALMLDFLNGKSSFFMGDLKIGDSGTSTKLASVDD